MAIKLVVHVMADHGGERCGNCQFRSKLYPQFKHYRCKLFGGKMAADHDSDNTKETAGVGVAIEPYRLIGPLRLSVCRQRELGVKSEPSSTKT